MLWQRFLNISNFLATVLTALGTALAAYAALKATESSERTAALQAISQFNSLITTYSRAGACIVALDSNHDPAMVEAMLAKTEFIMRAIKIGPTARCRQMQESELTVRMEITVPRDQSDSINQQIFNYLNGYEAILLYWYAGAGDKSLICSEVFYGYNEFVRPFVWMLQQLPNNPSAKSYLRSYPAIVKFMAVTGCI